MSPDELKLRAKVSNYVQHEDDTPNNLADDGRQAEERHMKRLATHLDSASAAQPFKSQDHQLITGKQADASTMQLPNAGSTLKRSNLKQLIVVSLLLIGLIICVTSLICILLLPTFVSNQISKRLVLKNNSMLLERWSKPNVPMYFKVWIFDVTNAQEVIDKRGTKPKLKEIGPFVFHLKRQKDIVSFSGDNLYYTERKVFHFSQELSCCAINTTVTIPNIPLVAVVDRALSYNLPLVGRFIPRLINRAIQSLREQLFVRKQVREILFDGYEVELLKMVSRVGAIVGLPKQNQKFAILKGRNDTWRPEQDGVWAINTGVRDRRQFGRVSSWNSYKRLPFWASPACNAINGSDGTLFPPPIKSTEPLYIFNQELCRTVNLVYDRPSNIRSIKALRFVLNPMNFAHTMSTPSSGATVPPRVPTPNSVDPQPRKPTTGGQMAAQASDPKVSVVAEPDGRQGGSRLASAPLPAQVGTRAEQEKFVLAAQEAQAQADRRPSQRNPFTCFCDRKSTNLNGINVCEFDGLIDLSKCTKQAQVIFGSMPHFHSSDPRLLRQVIGMEPNASKHLTYLDIEPNTGLVLGGKRRVQLNLLIKHNHEVDGFENINDMLVPVIWFEESAMIPEESAQKFKSLYTNRVKMINIVLISMFLASIGLIVIDLRLLLATNNWRQFKIVKIATSGCQSAKQFTASNSAAHSPPDSKTGSTLTTTTPVNNDRRKVAPINADSRTSGLASSLDSQHSRRKESTASTDSCSSSQGLTAMGSTDDDDDVAVDRRLLIHTASSEAGDKINQQPVEVAGNRSPQRNTGMLRKAADSAASSSSSISGSGSSSSITISSSAPAHGIRRTAPAKRSVIDLGATRQFNDGS